VQAVEILSTTPGHELPEAVRSRLGMGPEQCNARVRMCALDRTLTATEANRTRDRIYASLHRGSVSQWVSGHPPP
jgi:phenylalanyl-tRNA synthetase alpha chain